jgi:metal-responsive CopG/Arc/MetJ family transcriptional regulator
MVMARTPTPKRKPPPKLRGLRQPIALTLPPDLVAEIDVVAKAEDRSRQKIIEIGLRQFVQSYRQRSAA